MQPTDMKPGWDRARRLGGYLAAGALSLYLLVKVIWMVACVFGRTPKDFGTAEWVTLNVTTIVMAVAGVTLGLALAQPWGRRVPPVAVLFFAWMAAGFLVPMLPYMTARLILTATGVATSAAEAPAQSGTAVPAWETAMLTVGFGGMAVGVAIALPIYLRQRWPMSFVGAVRDHAPFATRLASSAGRPLVRLLLSCVAVIVLARSYETVAGPISGRTHMDLNSRMLLGNTVFWLLVAGWVTWQFAVSRPAGLPLWLPAALGFATSGFLFAWNAWLLFADALHPSDYTPGEPLPLAAVEHLLTAVVGAAVLTFVLPAPRAPAGSAPAHRGSPDGLLL